MGSMHERRRYPRIQMRDQVAFPLGDGQHHVSAMLVNISLGGAFIHSERMLQEGVEFAFVAVFPPGTLTPKWSPAWCRARVLRTNEWLVDGQFGTALRFLNVQAWP